MLRGSKLNPYNNFIKRWRPKVREMFWSYYQAKKFLFAVCSLANAEFTYYIARQIMANTFIIGGQEMRFNLGGLEMGSAT